MRRAATILSSAGFVLTEVLVLAAVLRLAADAPTAPVDDGEVLAALAGRLAAAGLTVWLVGGDLVCRAARARPHVRMLATIARGAPGFVRRAHGLACGATVALASMHPAIASAATTPHAGAAEAAYEVPVVRAPDAGTSSRADEPVVRAPVPPPAAAPSSREHSPPRTHVVVPGDNLWRIAAAEVARVDGTERAADAAVLPYWRALVDANRATLRSGDPAVIVPGEVITLPPLRAD